MRPRSPRVALVGLRGAGKSTLGQMLADDLGFPFVELSREIEKFAGCSISEIQALYGRTPTAATSAARWKKPSRSTPRR
jgi:XRE family aerobic/anaerobic benzoate catabolism transcriptional regulator